ncbi:MAG: UvrD-helicase domain-containing protein [Spirochaetales bacterium]|nr:UvrD-helicase domain-containing protein [Spirochaetales bacterium]
MRLDEYQQSVVDCNKNAVVSAGAGSGKTTVLAARFLRLVDEGRADVSEILTLTFTRKASAEMYERIYGILLANRDRPNVSKAVAEFEKANISTLDSFCSRIARDCSTLFGLPSAFRTDEDAVSKLALETSLDFILNNKDNDFLREFIYLNGFENVWKNFFLFISMNYLSIGSPLDFTEMYERQMETAGNELARRSLLVNELVAELLLLESDLKGVKTVQEQLAAYSASGLPSDGNYEELKKDLTVLDVGKPRGRSAADEFIRCKEIIDELRPAAESMRDLIGTLEGRALIEGLFSLTSDFQDELFSKKRTAGLLGFQDVLTIAVEGLKRDPVLRKYYKSMFRYIMIDEFQDNNSLQKELLYLLAERDGVEGRGVPDAGGLNPEKLFFVGDEKQSIYMFRGADVSVFKQLSSELSGSGGEALSLKRNYRSEPGLIDFFNEIFEHVMSDCSMAYQAAFKPLESRQALLSSAPEIRLLYKPYDKEPQDDSIPAEESEAWEISEYITSAVGRIDVSENGAVRKADFSDFAVLFRSGTNQKSYEKVFRANSIPYTVHSIRSLFQESPVNDVYNLLQICLYPEDRAASTALLRSPIMSLSDLSVVSFLLSKKPVFDEGQEICCRTAEDLAKYRRAGELYYDVNRRLDREPLQDIISDIWYGSGYRYLILRDRSLHGYLEYFDYLKQLAVRADSEKQTTAEFLDYVRENLGEYKKVNDLKILGYSAGGVQMMPVHQSKGLEFPVVIIANAGNTGVNDRSGSAPAYISAVDGLTFNLVDEDSGISQRRNFFYSRGKEENKAREEAELRRLLYVALTRAESHLLISGCHGRMNRSGERSMLNMFLSSFGWVEGMEPAECSALQPFLKIITNRRWQDSTESGSGRVDIERITGIYRGCEPLLYDIRPNEFSASGMNSLMLEKHGRKENSKVRELSSLAPRLEELMSEKALEADFGTLCHRLIELQIKNGGNFLNQSDASAILRPSFRRISSEDWPVMFEEAGRLSSGFFGSKLWENARGAVSFESELPFTALTEYEGDGVYVKGVIDLLFETPDEVHIVDFKTDRRLIPGEYNTQMRIYVDAASAIYSKPAVCSLFYLREGLDVVI